MDKKEKQKQRIKEYYKEYYLKNKEKYKVVNQNQSLKKFYCETCNKELRLTYKALHVKSKIHIKNLNNV